MGAANQLLVRRICSWYDRIRYGLVERLNMFSWEGIDKVGKPGGFVVVLLQIHGVLLSLRL